jgi:tetratricopeptide (TPR) repeat protein
MGKGPAAEMRYVVPLIAFGAILSAVAVVTLWRMWRPLGVLAAIALLFTNWGYVFSSWLALTVTTICDWLVGYLQLPMSMAVSGVLIFSVVASGPLAMLAVQRRSARLGMTAGAILAIGAALPYIGSPWGSCWPPTIYSYVNEVYHPYKSGDEEMLDLLAKLPAGTTVRVWPSFMIYPPMFYVPQLHYCDQLTANKPIRADLRPQLPDYLFAEKSQPEVFIVPGATIYLSTALEHLKQTIGPGKYRVCKALRRFFYYTGKPEIPNHLFETPPDDWKYFPGAIVLVAIGSAAEKCPALASDDFDREQGGFDLCAVANMCLENNQMDAAVEYCSAALQLDPKLADAHVTLGKICEMRHQPADAMRHYRDAVSADTKSAIAHYDLANVLLAANEDEEAERHYLSALNLKPDYPQAHFNLARLLLQRGRTEDARKHLTAALQFAPPGTQMAEQARALLRGIK